MLRPDTDRFNTTAGRISFAGGKEHELFNFLLATFSDIIPTRAAAGILLQTRTSSLVDPSPANRHPFVIRLVTASEKVRSPRTLRGFEKVDRGSAFGHRKLLELPEYSIFKCTARGFLQAARKDFEG